MALGTDISISKVNPIRFIKVDSELPSFDNTLFADEDFSGITSKCFEQTFQYKDASLIQVMADGEAPVFKKIAGGVETIIVEDNIEVYTDYKIYEYHINHNTVEELYFTVDTSTSSWMSEPVNVVALGTLDGFDKVEYYNSDPPTENNNWGFDFSTTLAKTAVNYIWIRTLFLDYTPSGEATIYDNQNEKVVIKQSNFRVLTFNTEPIPRYLAEMIGLFMGMDVFVINGVQYVNEDKPELERFGGTNLFNLSAALTQKNVLGINTFDLGFECATLTDEIMNLELKAVSGQQTLAVPEGYLIQSITAYMVAGTPTVKAGKTVGGLDLMYPIAVSTHETSTVNQEIAETGVNTIYLDISGAGAIANIYVILILNRQT